jgi:hypothetical protein
MAELIDKTGVQHYLNMIAAYERQFKKWEGTAEKVIKKYRDESRQGSRNIGESRFNILWSNVQTAMPAVFSRLPKPDVSRRYRDTDPVGRVAALILERALEFEVEHYGDYASAMKSVVLDRFLGGRGTAWVRYEPEIQTIPGASTDDGLSVTEDTDDSETLHEELVFEKCPVDYVHWRDFGHNVARTWEEVTTVWRKVYMRREALVERFGEEIGGKIPLDTAPDDLKKKDLPLGENNSEALIYEIWCKTSGKAYWLSKSLGQFVDEKDDPYHLEEFFPCPKPLYATITNESLEPVPDFKLYQDQATELDLLSDRIDGLIKALQVKGVYNSAIGELSRLFTEGENNTLIPVKDWTAFAEKNGLKGAIDLVDLVPIFQALQAAYQAMEQVKAQVHEITGLSDIIRGQSVASETATAQQLKGQYASLRLKAMQEDVARFAGDLIRIKAQMMCRLFDPQTLLQAGGAMQLQPVDQQAVQQAIELLRNGPIRDFRIDIQADSMVQMDEDAEKQSRIEMLTAVGGFLKQAEPVVQQAPQLAPLVMEMLKFGITAFKAGKTLEGVLDETADKIKQQAMQPQPQQPSPEQIKAQQEDAAHQREMQQRQQELQMEAMLERQRNAMEAQRMQQQQQMEMALEQQRMANDARMVELQAHAEAQTKILLAHIDRITKLEVAEISAQTTLSAQQMSAAQQGAQE